MGMKWGRRFTCSLSVPTPLPSYAYTSAELEPSKLQRFVLCCQLQHTDDIIAALYPSQ
jgi:hypothetical protein